MEFVSWDDLDIPNMESQIKFHGSKPPTCHYTIFATPCWVWDGWGPLGPLSMVSVLSTRRSWNCAARLIPKIQFNILEKPKIIV